MRPDFISRARNFLGVFGWTHGTRWVLLGLGIRAYPSVLRALAPKDRFDVRHHVDTAGVGVPVDVDEARSDAAHSGVEYWPTPKRVIRHTLRELGIEHSDYRFIDYGAGKGRVVLTALEFPFERIIGVEWSKSLIEVAERNLQVCRGLRRRCRNVSFVVADAQQYRPSTEPTIFFLSNPFGQSEPTVLRRVLQQIDDAFRGSDVNYILIFMDIHKPSYDVVSVVREMETCRLLKVYENLHPNYAWAVSRNFVPGN